MCFAGWLFINGFKVQIQLELDESSKFFDLHAWLKKNVGASLIFN